MARAKKPLAPRFIPIVSQRASYDTERAFKRREKARKRVSIGARDKRGRFIPKKKRLKVPEVAREFGLTEGIEYARRLDWNPDDWAREVADDFDVGQHDLYNAYYGYTPDGAGTW